MHVFVWSVDRHEQLTAQVRAWLVAQYNYTAPAEHTWAALVSIRVKSERGVTCAVTFPFSFVMAGAKLGDIEAAIAAQCASRRPAIEASMLTARNLLPLSNILGAEYPLN